jgi:NAD(P)-dependent dehydrogenase (short-subunit alcohol dehydrogenase family)
MTSAQHKIGSGFGATSTAAEVLTGIDLTGKLAIVTGGYSGIGLETTRALTGAGAEVVVPARRRSTAEEALAGIDGVETDELDLADLESVRGFAERFLATGRRIDLFIGSAGIMACPETRVGPGWEAQFATNHLGHYALVNRLFAALTPGSRVVAVSSVGHRRSAIRWDDLHFETGYDKWAAYGQSKTANVLFAVEASKRWAADGITVNALHPGSIRTNLQRHVSEEEIARLRRTLGNGPGWKTPEQGAATSVLLATSPLLAGIGGRYFEDCNEALPNEPGTRTGVAPYALDEGNAERLWRVTEETLAS